MAFSGGDSFGLVMILISEALLASVNTIVKYVHDWSTQRMMVIRNPTDFCLCLAIAAYLKCEVPNLKVSGLLLLRSMAYITFISLFWVSLKSCIPIGDVVVFLVTFSPAFFVILSRVMLGEKIPPRFPAQFVICVVGALLINKPLTLKESCPASTALWPLSSALAGATMNFMSRNVKQVPPPIVCMFNDSVAVVFAIVTSAFGTFGADAGVSTLVPAEMDKNVALLVLAGLIGCVGLMANVKGYQSVSVSAIASIGSYASVPMAYAIQVFFFKDAADPLSIIGATLIVCTNIKAIAEKYTEDKLESEKLESGYMPVEDGTVVNIKVEPSK